MEVCLCPQTRFIPRHIQGEGVIKIWFLLPEAEISKSVRRQGTIPHTADDNSVRPTESKAQILHF
jgi:hypothetical protein